MIVYYIQCPSYVSIQAVSTLHPRLRCIYKNFNDKVCRYIPKLQKICKKFHHRFMVKHLELQTYIEKLLKRPNSLFFFAKGAVEFLS